MSRLPSPDRWSRLEPLLDAAVDVDRENRARVLDEMCGGDALLRAEVEELLEELSRRDVRLERPAAERYSALLDDSSTRLPDVLDGRYRIGREIGRGGMATVYVAHDLRHDRDVAVKVLHPDLAVALGSDRFLSEIRTTAKLQHSHILPLYDSGEANGLLFYVMPFVKGKSLRQRLERERPLPVGDAVRIAREVAGALDHAHRSGIVHRDIKPENILLRDGTALVADFGIALAVSAAASPRLTQPGRLLGTPQYMSPEQASGAGTLDARADVYSLGSVLYEMLAGEPPFTGATATMVLAKRSAMPAPSVSVLRPTVPAALDAVVARAIARDPANRYQTAGEFAAALDEALRPPSSATPTASKASRLISRRLGVAMLALAIISVAVFTLSRVGSEPRSIAVLPFADMGGDSSNAFFAAGMSDALSSGLSRVAGVRVIAGAGAVTSGGAAVNPQAVGRILHVATILQGGVQRANGALRVTIQLVGTDDGRTRWSNQYTHKLEQAADLFAVEDEIVADVLKELRVRLSTSGDAPARMVQRPTGNLAAYDLYRQGKYFQDQGGLAAQMKALVYFDSAIVVDPNLAEAHSGLADVYIARGIGNMGDFPPEQEFQKARAAARRALAIDSLSPEALTAAAKIALLYDFDWAAAERAFALALERDPHYTMARTYHAVLLEFTGRFDSALVEARAATTADPLSRFASLEASRALIFGKKYDLAIVQLQRLLERDSSIFRAHLLLGQALEHTGKGDSAVGEMQHAVRSNPKSSRTHAFLAHAYGLAGRKEDALREIGVLHERARHDYVPAFDFAVAYMGLGRTDETFMWLERAFAEHSIRPYLMDETFDPIRSDPRYQQLLRAMHHPLASEAPREPR